MKKLFIAASLAICAFASYANASTSITHIKVADVGEVLLSDDGYAAGIVRFDGTSDTFMNVDVLKENGCIVSLFNNINQPLDILTITLCERDKPMIKLGRYYGDKKVGSWQVDAEHYVYFDSDK